MGEFWGIYILIHSGEVRRSDVRECDTREEAEQEFLPRRNLGLDKNDSPYATLLAVVDELPTQIKQIYYGDDCPVELQGKIKVANQKIPDDVSDISINIIAEDRFIKLIKGAK